MTPIDRNFRLAQWCRFGIIAWAHIAIVSCLWNPQVCIAMACVVPILALIPNIIEYADVPGPKPGA